MNVKLAFTPLSQNPVDLVAVVLDDEKTLHEIDDPQIAAHVQRAAAAFKDKTLRKRLKGTKPKTFQRSGEYKPEKVEEDKAILTEYYRRRGYRDAEILADSVNYSDDRRWILLTFYVAEGDLYRYGNFTWSGNKLFGTEQLDDQQ